MSEFQPAYFEEGFGHAFDRVQLTPLPLGNGFSLSLKGQITVWTYIRKIPTS
jgi:ATP-dependent helicase/nuclease subunit B